MPEIQTRKFYFEITSLEDFIRFVRLIQGGEDIDPKQIEKLTEELNRSDQNLEDAINQGDT